MPKLLAACLTPAALLAVAAPAQAAAGPRIGRTAVVKRVSGRVLVRPAGGGRSRRLTGARTLPIRSTVDATGGKVRLTTARDRRGRTQSGVFSRGAFAVVQSRNSPLTELRLTGSGRCGASSAGGVRAARRTRRRLFGRAHGRFRTRGRQSSATVRGTSWVTEDLCNGATLTRAIAGGHVIAKSKESEKNLKPGESSEDYCAGNGYPGVSDLYCMSLFSDPKNDVFGIALVTLDPGTLSGNPQPGPRSVDVCYRTPQGASDCATYPLEDLGSGSWLQSDGCGPKSGTGVYTVRWILGGHELPVPLTYTSTHRGAAIGCNDWPGPGPQP